MFGWFKRRREAHKADVERRILEYGAEQARKRDVLANATRPDKAGRNVVNVSASGGSVVAHTLGSVSVRFEPGKPKSVTVKPTVRFTSPPKPSYSPTPSSVRDGYYDPSPAMAAAYVASSGWDAGSSSSSCSSDSGSSSSSCDSGSSGCGGGGCGGG